MPSGRNVGRSGNSRTRSSRSRNLSNRSRGGVHVTYVAGSSRYFNSSKLSLKTIWISFLAFVLFVYILIGYNFSLPTKNIEKDARYYASMIDFALLEGNKEKYVIDAKVTKVEKNGNKYYIKYTIKNYPSNWGESFPIYTQKEAMDLLQAKTVQIALEFPYENMSLYDDSVPIDHTIDKLNVNSNYVDAKKTTKIYYAISSPIVGVLATIFIYMLVKSVKQNLNNDNIPEDALNKSVAKYTCKYCGSAWKNGQYQCGNCGASEFVIQENKDRSNGEDKNVSG